MSKAKMVFCMGSSCYARGNAKNIDAAETFLNERGLSDEIDIDLSGCLCTGNCGEGPIVLVDDQPHQQVDAGAVRDILLALFPDK